MKRKLTLSVLSLLCFALIWFLAADRSWFVEECPDCMFVRDIVQSRLFCIPIRQQTEEHETLLAKVAGDLGAGCNHPHLARWHKHRWWGLLICARPCINGTTRLVGGDEWYDPKARAIVKEMVRNDPSLRDEIVERVLNHHDWEYWKLFIERVRKEKDKNAAAHNGKDV